MKFWKKLFIGLTSVIISFLTPTTSFVFAKSLSESELYFYGQNGIYYYMPGNENGSCGPGTISGNSVTIIGDSISVGAQSEYTSQIPNADFSSKTYNGTTYEMIQVSKHFSADAGDNYSGMTIAEEVQKQGDMRPYLVFALGTNDPGAVSDSSISSLMDLVGTNHKVVLVTNYAVDDQLDYSVNNAAIRAAADKYSNVAVADWANAVKDNPNTYIGDGYVHPNAAGSKLFVQLIKEALDTLAGGANGVSTGENMNYAGSLVWSETELQAIEANAPIYQEAAQKFNFPWQVLAVLHSLETGLRRWNPDNGQGIYQLYSYTGGGTNENRFEPAAEVSEEEFRRQTLIAAEIVSGMVGDLNNPDNVKRLFFSYNGRAEQYIQKARDMGFTEEEAQNGEGSPYVMNRYDSRRDPTSAGMDPAWPGRFVADGKYDPTATMSGFGGFVKYEAIAGGTYCTNNSAGGTIVDVAIELSWEGYKSHAVDDPKPEYVEAMKAVGTYWMGNGEAPYGASCDQFVATVMRYSGADPDFPGNWPPNQEAYMQNNPDKYQKIEANRDVSNLQPGDIFVVGHQMENGKWGNHIYLYIGEINGQPSQASASYNNRTGEHYAGISWMDYGMDYSVYRRINF